VDIFKLKKQLVEHEGIRLKPYRCTAYKLTIGIGRNLDDKGISEVEAMFMLNNDINECYIDCLSIFPWFIDLSEDRQHALIDMRFNLGAAGFRRFRKMIDAVNVGDFETAVVEMKDSLWYKQVGLRGKTLEKMMKG